MTISAQMLNKLLNKFFAYVIIQSENVKAINRRTKISKQSYSGLLQQLHYIAEVKPCFSKCYFYTNKLIGSNNSIPQTQHAMLHTAIKTPQKEQFNKDQTYI
jgi:hypothetical protein